MFTFTVGQKRLNLTVVQKTPNIYFYIHADAKITLKNLTFSPQSYFNL